MEKSFTHHKLALFYLLGAASALNAPAFAQSSPATLARQHVSIIRGLSASSKPADTKQVLAKNGITLTRTNRWITSMMIGVGHEFTLSGNATGFFLFSNREGTRSYSASNPINDAYINLPDAYLRSSALREAYIEALSRYLGKPELRRVSELENGKTIRNAFWKSKNGLSILVDFRYATNTLSLCLGNPEGPSHE